jgi:hypothetical protein
MFLAYIFLSHVMSLWGIHDHILLVQRIAMGIDVDVWQMAASSTSR